MATASRTTKKLKPVEEAAAPAAPTIDVNKLDDVIKRMDIMTQYMERIDWKLWMIMNMVKIIGEENGYHFESYQSGTSTNTTEPIER